MAAIQGVVKDVLEKTEWVAIITWDTGSPHLAATWGDYVRKIGIIDGDIRGVSSMGKAKFKRRENWPSLPKKNFPGQEGRWL